MKNLMLSFFLIIFFSCESPAKEQKELINGVAEYERDRLDTATFAGGCFWCIEACFEQIEGVVEAVSGYAGGIEKDADYYKVSSGSTDHTETVQIYFNPDKISFETLLNIFFTAHDPTQLNRQGPDVGRQYRSAIFYHNTKQKELAEKKMKMLVPSFSQPIVTQLNAYSSFYPAEDYHQNYEANHPFDLYILNVSKPKINRVKEKFKDILKEEHQ